MRNYLLAASLMLLSLLGVAAELDQTKTMKDGVVYRDYWTGIEGLSVSDLRADARFPGSPSGFDEMTSLKGPTGWGGKYGARVEALISPRVSGSYVFYVSSDDQSELWLSEDATPAKKRMVAAVNSATAQLQWGKLAEQKSISIPLEAGKSYYLELLYKAGNYGDHFAVGWSLPGESAVSVIGQEYIRPYLKQAQEKPLSSDIENAFKHGYRVGFDDATYGFPFYPTFPPLDTDGDGMHDNWEQANLLNKSDKADAALDPDGDLLTNHDEYVLRTDPNKADTDGDGLPDGYEVSYMLNPLFDDSALDTDGDGLTNLEEYQNKTDPTVKEPPKPEPIPEPTPTPTAPEDSGLQVEYYRSITGNYLKDLRASPKYPDSPDDSAVIQNFELPTNVADNFGARIRGYIIPKESGDYTFYITSDDQSELWLSTSGDAADASIVARVDAYSRTGQWTKYAYQKSAVIHLEAGKAYYVEVVYKEGRYSDNLAVAWQGPGFPEPTIVSGEYLSRSGNAISPLKLTSGLVGQYFNSKSFSSHYIGNRLEPQVNFNWVRQSPMEGVNPDNFGVRFVGKLTPKHASGTKEYTFYLLTDDFARLYVGGELISDQWRTQKPTEFSSTFSLEAGKEYDIKVEYAEYRYDAQVRVSWQTDEFAKEVIPAANLSSIDLGANSSYDGDADGMPDVWELTNGLDPTRDDSQEVYNAAGITALEAYSQKLNPWTAKPVVDPEPTTPTQPIPSDPVLSWSPPATRADGTALPVSELGGYEILYGASAAEMTNKISVAKDKTSHTLTGFAKGSYSFAIVAIDTDGNRSALSNSVTVNIL